jgi:N-acetylneuraminate synthase
MSTGMATLGEVEQALSVLAFAYTHHSGERPTTDLLKSSMASPVGKQALRQRVSLLHCTTEYPAPVDEINLQAMHTLRSAFGLPVGYSDHSAGIHVSIAAVAMGATIIEKHFTLDKTLPGPDHVASLEPAELTAMIKSIRDISRAMGDGIKQPTTSEIKNISIARKSLVAVSAIEEGELFTDQNLTTKRPGSGVSAMQYERYLGRRSLRSYEPDELIDEQ